MRRVLLVLGVLLAAAPVAQGAARHRLANGCFDVRAAGEPLATQVRMQATDLGAYLLYLPDGRYVGAGGEPVDAPSPEADWTVRGRGRFTLRSQAGETLPAPVRFTRARGCARYPNANTDVSGKVRRAARPWVQTRGLMDSHLHLIAEDAFGGNAHCGRPWHRYGAPFALVDCDDHDPGERGLAFENVLSGNAPNATHDTVGWPTFADWPNATSATHENTYYRWVERMHRSGLRLAVALFFDNAQLCAVWPSRAHECGEMESVRRQIALLHDLQDYVDAQSGGPGRGWLRIVRTPFQARRVINRGKLAVVMGLEVSRLFECRVVDGAPTCDKQSIDARLAEMRALGVRSLEITGKFDNALSGVAGDPGTTGVVTNSGNRLETGSFLAMETCEGLPSGAVDKEQISSFGPLGEPFAALVPGTTPAYPPPPHCNRLGLSDLGAHLINRIADRRMLMDPDHMSAAARIAALDIFAARGYSGVLSSHSWSTPADEPRIFGLGGVVFPKASAIGVASDTDWFVDEYARLRELRDPRYAFGFAYGSDANGVAKQPVAGPDSAVAYPHPSFDGRMTIRRPSTAERTWDFNAEGVAHYGLYADWLEELRTRLGRPFVRDMLRGPEAYLQMWERAAGVPARARPGRARVGMTVARLLRTAGQPRVRGARVWRYRGGVSVTLTPRGRVAGVAR